MGSLWYVIHDLQVERSRDAGNAPIEGGQQVIVKTTAVTQAYATRRESNARHQHELDFGDGHDRTALRRFTNSPDSRNEISAGVDYMPQLQGTLRTDHSRQQ